MGEDMKDLRVVFMGTPDFAVPVLKYLIDNTNVVLVVSKVDAYVGRHRILTPSPVKKVALDNNIPVFTPHRLRDEYQEVIDKKPDIIITCAYGQIVPEILLETPRLKCINVHASLLPKYRGASPISKCIMDSENTTGITIMYMDKTLDTGNIIYQKSIDVTEKDTLGTLTEKLSELGAITLSEVLSSIINGTNASIKQNDELSSYASIIKREDEELKFNKSVIDVYNHIRSLNPSPLANVKINGEEWKIVEAEIGSSKIGEVGIISEVNKDSFGINCEDGVILIKVIKPAGKKIMDVKSFFNGYDKNKLLNIKVGE